MERKKLFKINLIFMIIFLFFPLFSFADISIPNSPSNFYLDELGMIDEDAKENITETNRELEQKTGSQVVVVTMKNPDGLPASDLATKIFNSWTIGDQDKKNGVLMLITQDDFTNKREVFISTGYGIEGRLNDGKVGRIIDNFMMSNLKSGSYSAAINEGFNAIVGEIADEYGVELTGDYDYYLDADSESYSGGLSLGTIIFMFFIFIVISNMFTRYSFYGRPGRRYRRGYYNNPYNSYRRYGGSDPFRGSGWGNSSSFGGGSSFGGSGSSGGFTGGGGTTGGGGAGRSF